MADLPIELADPVLSDVLRRVLDVEGKIPRAFEALGPVAGRDVVLVHGSGGARAAQLTALGARVTVIEDGAEIDLPAGSADVIIGCWSAFRAADPAELARADAVLRPGGRLLVLHDYGRDDVARLRGELPEHGPWSRRNGTFTSAGFKIRVLHCFWTFGSIEEAQEFLGATFGAPGIAVGAELRRPRLSYNVAVYHRTKGAGG